MKLLGEGGTPKLLVIKGELKSSISLFSIIPVEFDINLEPKLGEEKEYDLFSNIIIKWISQSEADFPEKSKRSD